VGFHTDVVAEDSHCVVSVELSLGLAHRVLQKSRAVVVFVEDFDVGRDQVEFIHPHHMLTLLLALRQGLVLGELVDVLQNEVLFIRVEILKHVINVLGEEHGIVLLGIVEDSDQPVEMVLQ
jgi:hypothetical protein